MKFSIITPSYNQGMFLEQTIISVISQNVFDFEYIIIDGDSNDNSKELIKKYEKNLSYWQSKKDNGQSDAINQGLKRATGEIIAWINSDDYYEENLFEYIHNFFSANDHIKLIYGNAFFVDSNNNIIEKYPASQIKKNFKKYAYWRGWPIPQPTLFFRRCVYEKIGGLNEKYHYAMDYEWITRAINTFDPKYIDKNFAYYRIHESSKTSNWEASKKYFFNECKKANQINLQEHKVILLKLSFDKSIYMLLMKLKKFKQQIKFLFPL